MDGCVYSLLLTLCRDIDNTLLTDILIYDSIKLVESILLEILPSRLGVCLLHQGRDFCVLADGKLPPPVVSGSSAAWPFRTAKNLRQRGVRAWWRHKKTALVGGGWRVRPENLAENLGHADRGCPVLHKGGDFLIRHHRQTVASGIASGGEVDPRAVQGRLLQAGKP